MIYTYRRGIDKQLKEKAVKSGGIVLPIVSLLFLIIAALSFSTSQGSGQSPNIPVSKPQQASASAITQGRAAKPSSQSQSPKTTANSLAKQPVAAPAMSPDTLGGSSPAISVAPTPPLTGGMGGGDLPSGGTTDTGGGTTGTSGGSGTGSGSTPTVKCTNALTIAQICTACTPPLTLQPGQKAILSADGTCVAVN